jgi:hypothetical protein
LLKKAMSFGNLIIAKQAMTFGDHLLLNKR